MTHICVSKLTNIGSDNGLSPGRRQAIIWTNAGILLIWPLGTNFSEISIDIHTFSLKKIHFKMSSGKLRPFCLGLNVLKSHNRTKQNKTMWDILSNANVERLLQSLMISFVALNNTETHEAHVLSVTRYSVTHWTCLCAIHLNPNVFNYAKLFPSVATWCVPDFAVVTYSKGLWWLFPGNEGIEVNHTSLDSELINCIWTDFFSANPSHWCV